ncbi:S9 family peptidase, partial [candidate division KSB1 bacterium]
FLINKSSGLTTLADMAAPFVNLGETEYDHIANRSRRMTTGTGIGFEFFNWQTEEITKVQVPEGAKVSNASWSPDGTKIAFFAHFKDATHIYTAEVKDGKVKQITDKKTPVNATMISSFYWTADGKKILTVLIPENRGSMPQQPAVATEPKVRLTRPSPTTARTNRFLMEMPWEKELLEYLATGQLAMINVDNRKVEKIGEPDMINGINMAPKGDFFRVTRMLKPFSYFASTGSFGRHEELWDANANVLIDTMSYRVPPDLREPGSGGGGGRGGGSSSAILENKQGLGWAPDGNGMIYTFSDTASSGGSQGGQRGAQAQNPAQRQGQRGGQTGQQPRGGRRSPTQLVRWLPPFDENSTEVIFENDRSFSNIVFSEDFSMLFARENLSGNTGGQAQRGGQTAQRAGRGGGGGGASGQYRLFYVNLNDPGTKHTLLEYDGRLDRYASPGNIMTKRSPFGSNVIRMSTDKQYVFFSGTKTDSLPDVNPEFPFIDKVSMSNPDNKERIFEGSQSAYERVGAILNDDVTSIMVTSETRTLPSNTFMHDLTSGNVKKMTNNIDYTPDLTGAQRREYTVKRVDGFEFRVRVALPQDYVEGTKLPAMFWFYPREYAGETMEEAQAAYDRGIRPQNPNRFPSVSTRNMIILTRLGYAFVEPDCPIVGKPNQMNDNFQQDLRNSLWAVIDHLDKLEIIDRDRLGLGGHSYGAFGTANAMIHTPFFKAGIAGDGNYNRTLTPMSFQSERRNIWEARETYFSMSPLFWAERLNGALLMYHGMDDANVGTWPINSERMFQILDGLGKTASLYMYPYEHHGPSTIE